MRADWIHPTACPLFKNVPRGMFLGGLSDEETGPLSHHRIRIVFNERVCLSSGDLGGLSIYLLSIYPSFPLSFFLFFLSFYYCILVVFIYAIVQVYFVIDLHSYFF